MESADSKIYPGIVRQPGARQEDPANPAKLNVPSGPGPYTRRVAVYIPAGYTPGSHRSRSSSAPTAPISCFSRLSTI